MLIKSGRFALIALLPLAVRAADTASAPTEWIDPDTGHRVVQLSRDPGTASLYFHQNAYTPDGKKLIVTTGRRGIATIDLATHELTTLVESGASVIVAGRKTGDVYYTVFENNEPWVCAVSTRTKAVRKIAKLTLGPVSSINADETLLLGSYIEGSEGRFGFGGRGGRRGGPGAASAGQPAVAGGRGAEGRGADAGPAGPRSEDGTNPTFQARYQAKWPDGTPMTYAEAKDLALHHQLMNVRQGPPRVLFTMNTQTGETKVVLKEHEWLNHLQFSPTDSQQIMFCHEGTWHEVDRVWLVHTDGSNLTKVHTRTMNMEIAGHEFFNADGKRVWYDLQTPRGEDFWLGGYEIATGKRTWFHLQRDEWSVHYNVSPDGTLFCGDGGDDEMVAHAKDGKWIYLFRPERIRDVAGVKNPSSDQLIDVGVFRSERLVNMKKHNYQLEPNVSFTPDMKWIVFRSNMTGVVHTYAVEIAKAK